MELDFIQQMENAGIVTYIETIKHRPYRNNYEKLKRCGFNGKSLIFDELPMGDITFGEYMNITPVGLSKAQLQRYYDKRKEKIAQLCEVAHTQAQREKKSKQKARIREYISSFKRPFFVTITFNDEWIKMDYKRKIKAIFSKYNIKYCLVSDYGEETSRLHYHGFLDIDEKTSQMLINSGHKSKKNDKIIWHFQPFVEIGFHALVFNNTKKDIEKSLNYCVKYITKDIQNDKKHCILRSRDV